MARKLVSNSTTILLKVRNSRYYRNLYNKSNLTSVVNATVKSVQKRFNQTNCWKCGVQKSNITQMFCEKCNIIQNPHEKLNYFKLFGLDEVYTIDQRLLREKYRQMQSLLHPDKFTNRSDEERNISEEYSSLVNKAYNSLQVSMSRAQHLLRLKGEQINENDAVNDPKFLMDIMTLNEEVENEQDPQELKRLNFKNHATLEEISKEIDKCFKKNDVVKAKEFIIKMKYYNSLSKRINAVMRELGVVD